LLSPPVRPATTSRSPARRPVYPPLGRTTSLRALSMETLRQYLSSRARVTSTRHVLAYSCRDASVPGFCVPHQADCGAHQRAGPPPGPQPPASGARPCAPSRVNASGFWRTSAVAWAFGF
jgi:hypothetical protein